MKCVINWISKLFHSCRFEKIVDISYSNENGKLWVKECKCGMKMKVMFDANGECLGVTDKKRMWRTG